MENEKPRYIKIAMWLIRVLTYTFFPKEKALDKCILPAKKDYN
ncbi:MAG: hypothetical protein PH343_03260 [Nitrospira sp.]|nr:hypothetical protein [Nitrospira sp.]